MRSFGEREGMTSEDRPRRTRVVVLGGGMAGIGAAHALAGAGLAVTVVERGTELGGLAGSFEQDGRFYPIGYHHILSTDRTLRRFLAIAGVEPRVRWRRVRVLFALEGALHELGSPRGLARFPLPWASKLRLLRLMLRAFARRRWDAWEGRSAAELVACWGDDALGRVLFEPLAQLKFRRPLAELSAAWLGARLHAREGASPLGYVPDANWTKLLCDGLHRRLVELGCDVRLGSRVERLRVEDGRVAGVGLAGGEELAADAVVSTLPTPMHCALLPEDATAEMHRIRYTALISAVCATPKTVAPEFYWLNLSSLDRTACAIFDLTGLNPTIGGPGERCLNFVTHLAGPEDALFALPDEELVARYRADAVAVLGIDLRPEWVKISRVAHYSPIFDVGYRNPPARSTTFANLYYAGNYRTYPAVASTGTALASGLAAAAAVLGAMSAPAGRRT